MVVLISTKPVVFFIKIQYLLSVRFFGFQNNKSIGDTSTDLVYKLSEGLGEREKPVSIQYTIRFKQCF